jgi:hypothetical protein
MPSNEKGILGVEDCKEAPPTVFLCNLYKCCIGGVIWNLIMDDLAEMASSHSISTCAPPSGAAFPVSEPFNRSLSSLPGIENRVCDNNDLASSTIGHFELRLIFGSLETV